MNTVAEREVLGCRTGDEKTVWVVEAPGIAVGGGHMQRDDGPFGIAAAGGALAHAAIIQSFEFAITLLTCETSSGRQPALQDGASCEPEA